MAPPIRVLFVCTANACRSQMAEAMLRALGGERFVARSAGVCPVGWIHPLTAAGLESVGIPLGAQYSKGYDEMRSLEHDLLVTVCDHAACELPREWKGDPAVVHWSVPDPVTTPGTAEEKQKLVEAVAREMRARIEKLVAMPLETMSRAEAGEALQALGSEWDH